MKKKNFIALLAVGCLLLPSLFSSCSKELDIHSEVAIDANTKLSPEVEEALLVGLYQRIMSPSRQGYWNIVTSEIFSDNLELLNAQWFQVQNMFNHDIPANDILLSYSYFGYYTAISRANKIISRSASEAVKAKARYCRALSYLRLYDIFTEAPIARETDDPKALLPKASPDDLFAYMIEDLKVAAESAPEFQEGGFTAPTREAAWALLARIYYLMDNKAEAGQWAERVISSGRFTIAKNPAQYDEELIFALRGTKQDGDGAWGAIMSSSLISWNCFGVSQSLYDLVKPGDKRSVLFRKEKITKDGATAIFSTKYSREEDADLIISRISEMYLISAWAGNAARLTTFQTIRNSNLSLADERRLELSFEWCRWLDLKKAGETYRPPYPQRAAEENPNLNN